MTQDKIKKFIKKHLKNDYFTKTDAVKDLTNLLDNWISVEKFELEIDKEWRDVLQADYSLDYENGVGEGFRLAKIIFRDKFPQPPKDTE